MQDENTHPVMALKVEPVIGGQAFSISGDRPAATDNSKKLIGQARR
jgi:hypothetical protein